MGKRFICLLLALTLAVGVFPVVSAAEHGVVDIVDHWAENDIIWVMDMGLFNGTSSTTFNPNGTMTRGMFVTVLGRMAGVFTDEYAGISDFEDVSPDAYYAPYVAWAAKHGITTGTTETTFSPSALITRQQMATFFVRYFDTFNVELEIEEEVTTVPADIESAAPYAFAL